MKQWQGPKRSSAARPAPYHASRYPWAAACSCVCVCVLGGGGAFYEAGTRGRGRRRQRFAVTPNRVCQPAPNLWRRWRGHPRSPCHHPPAAPTGKLAQNHAQAQSVRKARPTAGQRSGAGGAMGGGQRDTQRKWRPKGGHSRLGRGGRVRAGRRRRVRAGCGRRVRVRSGVRTRAAARVGARLSLLLTPRKPTMDRQARHQHTITRAQTRQAHAVHRCELPLPRPARPHQDMTAGCFGGEEGREGRGGEGRGGEGREGGGERRTRRAA